MSHAATNWAIRQKGLKPATKIVLWHLADCHNAHTGQCNPKQSTLAEECEMSRSTVNLHLDKLEETGLIRRVQKVDSTTRKKRPTHYILALDDPRKPMSENRTRAQDAEGEHTTSCGTMSENRTRKTPDPCPKTGHEPCPKNRHSHVRNSDIRNPVKEPGSKNRSPYSPPEPDFDAFWSLCPRKVGKGAAEKAFAKAVAEAGEAAVVAGMRRHVSEVDGKDPQFIPHPATWLNQRRWEDEPQPEQPKETRRGSDVARRAAERWRQSRGVDSGPDQGPAQPLLPPGDRRRG